VASSIKVADATNRHEQLQNYVYEKNNGFQLGHLSTFLYGFHGSFPKKNGKLNGKQYSL
jgi:hypothetical protein